MISCVEIDSRGPENCNFETNVYWQKMASKWPQQKSKASVIRSRRKWQRGSWSGPEKRMLRCHLITDGGS